MAQEGARVTRLPKGGVLEPTWRYFGSHVVPKGDLWDPTSCQRGTLGTHALPTGGRFKSYWTPWGTVGGSKYGLFYPLYVFLNCPGFENKRVFHVTCCILWAMERDGWARWCLMVHFWTMRGHMGPEGMPAGIIYQHLSAHVGPERSPFWTPWAIWPPISGLRGLV